MPRPEIDTIPTQLNGEPASECPRCHLRVSGRFARTECYDGAHPMWYTTARIVGPVDYPEGPTIEEAFARVRAVGYVVLTEAQVRRFEAFLEAVGYGESAAATWDLQ